MRSSCTCMQMYGHLSKKKKVHNAIMGYVEGKGGKHTQSYDKYLAENIGVPQIQNESKVVGPFLFSVTVHYSIVQLIPGNPFSSQSLAQPIQRNRPKPARTAMWIQTSLNSCVLSSSPLFKPWHAKSEFAVIPILVKGGSGWWVFIYCWFLNSFIHLRKLLFSFFRVL